MSAYTTIVVGADGSQTASRAVDRAARIAADTSASLVLVTAYEPEPREVVTRRARRCTRTRRSS